MEELLNARKLIKSQLRNDLLTDDEKEKLKLMSYDLKYLMNEVYDREYKTDYESIIGKYVICSFDNETYILVRVVNETKDDFSFYAKGKIKIRVCNHNFDEAEILPYTQSKNTIIAVADQEWRLREWQVKLNQYEEKINDSKSKRDTLVDRIKKYEENKVKNGAK